MHRLFLLLALAPLAAACSTTAEELSPENRGNMVFSLHGDDFETSRPGEYSSGSGDPRLPLLVLAHAGRGSALRSHQSGTGSAAQLVADGTTPETPALAVHAGGTGPAARLVGGHLAIGTGSTIVLESIARVTAADRIPPPSPAAVILIEATPGSQQNVLVAPAAIEGQLLWVVNDDDDPVSLGDEIIPAGETRQLLYAGGRFRSGTARAIAVQVPAAPAEPAPSPQPASPP